MIKCFWWRSVPPNFGDELSPVILQHFTDQKVQYVPRETEGKLLAIGSIIQFLKKGDTVWGTGMLTDYPIHALDKVRFLSVRGSITRGFIHGAEVPEVYGDPALLLPLMYQPKVEKKHKVGVVPHYVDRASVNLEKGQHLIDIQSGWQNVVNEIISCETIISSSLHGLIAAEAYGIPAMGARYPNSAILNQELKWHDYFTGTDRENQEFWNFTRPINNLPAIQSRILKALKDL